MKKKQTFGTLLKKLLVSAIHFFSKKRSTTHNKNEPPKNLRFIDIFCDPNGNLSSMRLCFVWFTLVVSLCWFVISIQKQDLQEIPRQVVYIIMVLAGGKSLQSFWGK